MKTLRLVYFPLSALVTLPKNYWSRLLGSVVIQLYAGDCTPSVDRTYKSGRNRIKMAPLHPGFLIPFIAVCTFFNNGVAVSFYKLYNF